MTFSAKVIFGFFIVFVFLRNLLMPLMFDDYLYAFIWQDSTLFQDNPVLNGRVQSLYDIFISQWAHYFVWGGRAVLHSFVQFFVMIDKIYFDIVNTLMFALLIWLINRIATDSNNLKVFNLIWIILALWICPEQLAFTTLWITGTCNYMWSMIFQLLFLLPYINEFRGYKNFKSYNFFVLPLGIIAGWSNESGSLTTVGIAIVLLYFIRKRQKLNHWLIAGFVSLVIGCVLLMAAPGNFARLSFSHPNFHFTLELLIEHLTNPFYYITSRELVLFLPIIYYFFKRINKIFKPNEILILIFTVSGIAIPTIMLFSPEFASHTGFSSNVFLIIASIISFEMIIKDQLYPRWSTAKFRIIKYITIIIISLNLVTMLFSLYSDFVIYKQIKTQLKTIAKHKNDDVIYLPHFKHVKLSEEILGAKTLAHYLFHFEHTISDPSNYYTAAFYKFYGIKKILLKN